MTHAELSRAFSAGVSGQSDTWGDAPGWHDISAFGANQIPKKFLNFRRSSPSMRVRRRRRAASLTQPASTCTDPVLAGTTIASFGNWPNRLIAQTSVTGTKKHAKMIGHNTSRLMSRPRLNVRAAPSMNIISRSSDCLCSSQRSEQPSPKRYQYAGCHRTKDLAKVQNASADMLNRASWKEWITDL